MQACSRRIGEFIDLRPLRIEDAALTFAWRQAERARLLNAGAPDVDAQARWIAGRPAGECNFIIERKDGRPLGMLALVGIDKVNRHAESGRFLIGDEDGARGMPAAVEAMKLLYELAFDELGLVRVHGTVASGNGRMIKWQKYLGMKEEGRLRQHYFIDGAWQDAVCLGLLADEYRSEALPRMEVLIKMARQQAAQS
ncbi:GNAT family N-acetyltransferase [Massilia sp. Leaf139]|uniref:GNAT family N-acetyltransferase n=1 Tax=Massilia sp. Leaf139 TaxID=1736272 RepID=UPI0006F318E8|nr:GNAT family protein [Massilia sp. Leaf139]KQQ94950.1 acetyltransferase [Massilia sp. Leaf139]